MGIFRAFSNRSFALLWSGQIVSRLGDSLYTIALAWWILQKTGSATAMGIVLICSTIPMLLLLLFGGVAVDRLPRVCLMLTSDLIRGAAVLLYALLTTLPALGSIGAAFWLGHYKRLRRRGLLTYGAWLVASLMLLVIGLPLSIGEVSTAFFIQGVSFQVLTLVWTNSLQEFVPAGLLGRVSSIDMLVSSGLLPIGYGLAGIAADRLGASQVFVLGGTISASVIVLGLLHPAIRAVD